MVPWMLAPHCSGRMKPSPAVLYRRGALWPVFAFRLFVFVLLAFFSHSLLAQPITADDPQPASVSPVVVTNGWQITGFVLNNFGTLAFGGRGVYPFAADGLTLVRSNQFVRFVTAGDPVPGFSDKIFAGFLSFDFQ